ncbi:hypothetical protein G9F71_008255 [Clostridium sp. FP2]|uniref:hypothetical protein n=1 Tax=Clostridium sp. FP2 TaxID=2724481 RepID=UPI0013E932E0|nr:hypothetical protein [Clostridium sp. FP2]MBZ9622843.1 hypothetical protein [Clostridium sp. FP2]
MRKKIIIIIGVMLLSVMMFGCGNNSKTLKISKNAELKDEYKSKVSEKYAENFNETIIKYVELFNKKDKLEESDLNVFLKSSLENNKTSTNLNETERLLLSKSSKVFGDFILEYDEPTEKTKSKLKEDIQVLLDLYK